VTSALLALGVERFNQGSTSTLPVLLQ